MCIDNKHDPLRKAIFKQIKYGHCLNWQSPPPHQADLRYRGTSCYGVRLCQDLVTRALFPPCFSKCFFTSQPKNLFGIRLKNFVPF